MKLKPHLVLCHALAGQARPVDRLLTFFDVLLGGATLIVEMDDPVGVHRQVGHDEADAREQLAGMPLNLGNNALVFVPRRRLIIEIAVEAPHVVGRISHRALKQMRNLTLQNTIGTQPDGIEVALRFQHLVEVRNGKRGVVPEEPHQVTASISRYDRLQNLFPSVGAVHIAGAQSTPFELPKLVEHEQRVIAQAAEMAVPRGAFLCAVGRADRAVHVQRDPFGRHSRVYPVDPLPR